MTVAVVVPVYGNAETLPALVERLAVALSGTPWRLRLVIDASPDDSAAVARALAARDPRVGVTELAVNGGQHRAIARGLADESDAASWVVLDADLQDPPEAVPALLERLAHRDVDVVFAGRRGDYEGRGRRVTGGLHRRAVAVLTGLPRDAGAFFAVTPRGRATILDAAVQGAPSVVVALGAARRSAASVPVTRAARPVGASTWTSRARASQSARSLWWAVQRSVAGSTESRHGRRASATGLR